MKKNVLILVCAVLLAGGIPGMFQTAARAQVSVSFQVFYDQLSPYGTWVHYPRYGYVWVPAGAAGFRPYCTRGHWVYTDEGWLWVSDYSWGWACFHYGNWFYDDEYGWMWVPGYHWAPAWVTWGVYDGDYCWAPIRPGISIGFAFDTYRPPYYYWNSCPREYITSVNVSNYYVTNIRNTNVVNHITVINNMDRAGGATYMRGPAASNAARYAHSVIRPVAVQSAARPGVARVSSGQLAIYRPAVHARATASVRPERVRDLHSLRPVNRMEAPASNMGVNRPQYQTMQPAMRPVQPQQYMQPRQPVYAQPAQRFAPPRQEVQPAREGQIQRPAQLQRENPRGHNR